MKNGLINNHFGKTNDMDIYTEKGGKVIFSGIGGYDSELKSAKKYLKIGEIYTVDYLDIGGFHSDVYLEEFPNIKFNSVQFVNKRTEKELTDECEHIALKKITHWWFNFKCDSCGKRYRRIPKGDWYVMGFEDY